MDHKHIIVNASVRKPPTKGDEEKVVEWMKRLVTAVGMKVVFGPGAYYCDAEGNEGLTAGCVIETSHCSIHCWDKLPGGPVMKFDLYSCSTFFKETVIGLIREYDPSELEYIVIDRNDGLTLIDQGKETY